MIQQNQKEQYEKKVDKIHLFLFGDEDTNQKGMSEKFDDMYNFFVKINNGISLIGWAVGAIIVTGLLLGTIKGWLVGLVHSIATKITYTDISNFK